MTRLTQEDWQLWHDEIEQFSHRETTGFTSDLEFLHNHILKLQELCPKDTAGWTTGIALKYIERLQHQYNKITEYLKSTTPTINSLYNQNLGP